MTKSQQLLVNLKRLYLNVRTILQSHCELHVLRTLGFRFENNRLFDILRNFFRFNLYFKSNLNLELVEIQIYYYGENDVVYFSEHRHCFVNPISLINAIHKTKSNYDNIKLFLRNFCE
jgi:hypothetical protein